MLTLAVQVEEDTKMIKLTIKELEEWIKQNKPFKIRVTPETSRIVQEAVFRCGKSWYGGSKKIEYIDQTWLFFSDASKNKLTSNIWDNAYSETPEIELIIKPQLTALGCLPVIKPVDKWEHLKRQYAEDEKSLEGAVLNAWELYEFDNSYDSMGFWIKINSRPLFEDVLIYRRHKHADLMIAHANGAKLQYFDDSGGVWLDCPCPKFCDDVEYRIKPATVIINGIEVSKGLTEKPEIGATFWLSDLTEENLTDEWTWEEDDGIQMEWFLRGLCHTTKENAIAMSEAMLNFK